MSEILALYKKNQIDFFLQNNFGFKCNDEPLSEGAIKDLWTPVGNNFNNAATIDLLSEGDRGIVERLTNCIDAVLERKKQEIAISDSPSYKNLIKKAFPKYSSHCDHIFIDEESSNQAKDAADYVIFACNHGSNGITPTFDIVDRGVGIEGKFFPSTILSLHGSNKATRDKNYTIGTFGQGGSTALPSSDTTIIISKINGKYYFTLVRRFHLKNYKNHVYLYLNPGNEITTLIDDCKTVNGLDYLKSFFDDSSGTFIRMIDTEISKQYRDNAIDKPNKIGDFLNIELFGVGFPIRLVENRQNYIENIHSQDRYVYGTKLKLETWKKYVKKNYSGYIEVEYKKDIYKIHFYVILPTKEDDWGKDTECKSAYTQFNIHEKPIFFTVNGQYIDGVDFTKLKNNGLNYLQYRILVNIELDEMGAEKFNFFTTDRSRIRNRDSTNTFIDKIVKTLCANEKLIEINKIIALKSMASSIDEEVSHKISDEIKTEYSDYLKASGNKKKFIPQKEHNPSPRPENPLIDEIIFLNLTNTKSQIYIDEKIKIVINTGAYKHINQREHQRIYGYLDGNSIQPDTSSFMNGVIQYVYDKMQRGEHTLKYAYFPEKKGSGMIESREYQFEVIPEKMPEDNEYKVPELDVKYIEVEGKEEIISISKNETEKSIIILYCSKHPLLGQFYFGLDDAKIVELKSKFIVPSCLFALFLKGQYDEYEPEDKNNLIVSYIRSILKKL